MKFLCTSCKAKYQIADEKVIGRTVKMKCRQCGHVIEINQALIDSGGATFSIPPGAPVAVAPVAVAPVAVAPVAVAPVAVAPVAVAPVAPSPRTSAVTNQMAPLGTRVPPKPVRTTATAGEGGLGPRKPEPAKVPAPIAAPPASVRPAPASERKSQPLSSRIVPEAKSRPPSAPVAPERGSRPQASPLDVERKSRPQASPHALASKLDPSSKLGHRGAGASAVESRAVGRLPGVSAGVATSLGVGATVAKADPLAGAFTRAVEHTPAQSVPHPLAGDEWYVGVGEQPIGPIRLAEIRERAATGEITPECLVWRDGFEDWRQLSAFPELVAVVEDGIASAKSLVPPPGEALFEPVLKAPSGLPGGSELGTAQSRTAPAIQPAAAIVSALALPGAGKASRAAPIDEESFEVAGISRPKIPLAAWAAVAMALLLGVTMGVVFIKPEPPKQIIKYVEVPAKPAQQTAEVSAPRGEGEASASEIANAASQAAQASNGSAKRANSGTSTAAEAATVSSVAAPQGLKGLSGLRGLGPAGGPQANGAVGSASGSQLDSATLSKTVSRYTPSVRRSCWQPALDMKTPDAPATARVTARITVGPNGRVQSVTTSGDPKGYRGLATCIQTRVKNWEFPPAGGSTEVNVPFVFAAQ